MPLRHALAVLMMLAVALIAGPASATETPTPAPTPTEAVTPAPVPAPTDGIREVPAPDEGADVYSVVTLLLFFAIAMGLLFLIIRAGMRATDRED